jgi:hypothetical protein
MPIRTPKGRGAAYRPLWQWPLRSPARLIGCLVVLIGLAVAGNLVLGNVFQSRGGGIFADTGSPAPARSAPGAAAVSPAPPARLPPVPELAPRRLPDSAAPPAALTAATRWTRAWAHHPPGTTAADWVNGLRPYTTEEYLGVLSSVDPSNVPASRVTGPARAVLVSPHSVRVEIPTDAVDLVVLVVNVQGRDWKVAGYDRADSSPDSETAGPAPSGPVAPTTR